MVETQLMAKDKTFNLRLDGQDRARLDEIAEYHSAPAATAVRILIKKEFDRLVALRRKSLSPVETAVLKCLFEEEHQMSVPELEATLDEAYDQKEIGAAVKSLRGLRYVEAVPPRPKHSDPEYVCTERGVQLFRH